MDSDIDIGQLICALNSRQVESVKVHQVSINGDVSNEYFDSTFSFAYDGKVFVCRIMDDVDKHVMYIYAYKEGKPVYDDCIELTAKEASEIIDVL